MVPSGLQLCENTLTPLHTCIVTHTRSWAHTLAHMYCYTSMILATHTHSLAHVLLHTQSWPHSLTCTHVLSYTHDPGCTCSLTCTHVLLHTHTHRVLGMHISFTHSHALPAWEPSDCEQGPSFSSVWKGPGTQRLLLQTSINNNNKLICIHAFTPHTCPLLAHPWLGPPVFGLPTDQP